ncbi:integral membrane protein DUF92-domain-containing protein [Mycena floridula]|nr:integral membrane protein DUF92-domain-containing protein [Mycena floridula]
MQAWDKVSQHFSPISEHIIPLLLALALSVHGLRKKSLSPSGAATAFFVGWGMLGGGTRVFGIALIGFYLAGSRATKYGKNRKALLEEGYEENGYRTGWQVLSNSFSALICCVLWNFWFSPHWFDVAAPQCLVEQNTMSRVFVFGALGCVKHFTSFLYSCIGVGYSAPFHRHFGCCLGDTLASELGILASSSPRLVTTWKAVPPGTNGAISLGGTLASILGGLFMGLIMAGSLAGSCGIRWDMLLWGALSGFGGSLVDSFLGATIQQTRYNEDRQMIAEKGQVLNGMNILTNNQVNVVSSIVTAICCSQA